MLRTPPAFILSQDQTLSKNFVRFRLIGFICTIASSLHAVFTCQLTFCFIVALSISQRQGEIIHSFFTMSTPESKNFFKWQKHARMPASIPLRRYIMELNEKSHSQTFWRNSSERNSESLTRKNISSSRRESTSFIKSPSTLMYRQQES